MEDKTDMRSREDKTEIEKDKTEEEKQKIRRSKEEDWKGLSKQDTTLASTVPRGIHMEKV